MTTTKKISFAIGLPDRERVDAIVRRALAVGLVASDERLDLEMDLTATHANGCPMDFQKLLVADDFNFAHDVNGIRWHIDRTTGELTDFFVPRCAKPER